MFLCLSWFAGGVFDLSLFPLIGQPPVPSVLSGHAMSYVQYRLRVALFNIVCSLVRYIFSFHKFSYVLSQLLTLGFTNMKLGPELYAIYFSWREEMLIYSNSKKEIVRFI